ncbi:glycoside hydrolase family 2 TIM barrel-domain containing protein [Oleiharenicola lentus]|uniref:glycoside hydrolase family 2 protein n=1 Tax=Oleiharenicola lentus TaxID=2508720 RepID=UPI003F67CC8F
MGFLSRSFRFTLTLVSLSTIWFGGGCQPSPQVTKNNSRAIVSLNEHWQFRYGAEPTPQQLSGATVVDWPKLSVPHTWNAADGANGKNDYARGTGWYFRKFKTEATWNGRRVFIQFDGVNRIATIYLNGKLIGEHVGGYARFRFDLTDALRTAGENTLAVKVSNAPDGTAPISADYTFFGGIYRDVKLFSVDPLHIDVTDHASDGIYVTPTNVSTARASFSVATLLKNTSAVSKSVLVRTVIKDADGKVVGTIATPRELAPGSSLRHEEKFSLDNPRLWNARQDPHQYTVEVSLLANDVVRDSFKQSFGLRFFHVDAEKGFFLNGQYLDLHGVNRHQDRAGKGWAISPEDEREDFAMIQEMGATAIRVAHYPQSQLWFDLADQHGLALWAEIPVVNEVPVNDSYLPNARQQLRELIRQNYNRPSIFFWGVGNETRQTGEGPGGQKPNPPEPNRVVADLATLAKAEDPTRLSTYASHHRPEDIRHFHADTLAFNKYIGWYGGKAEDFGKWIDDVHAKFPALRLGMSEYGAGASILHHEIPPQKPAPAGEWHPEEYQSHFHEVYWQTMRARPYLWGKFIWNMFDFAADDRTEGDAHGMNDKGLVTYDRKTRKDAFYFYKANWSSEPTLHLASKRFTNRQPGPTTITVYASSSQVELLLNGVSQGSVSSDTHAFRWNVTLVSGKNHFIARTLSSTNPLTDEVTFICPPPANP